MKNANIGARAIYFSLQGIAKLESAVNVMRDIIVMLLVIIFGEKPKSDAIITGMNDVYRPICTGSHASWAYAIDCGISTKETVIHAYISFFSTVGFFSFEIQLRNGKMSLNIFDA